MGLDPYLAAVLLHDRVGHCQSESCTLAHALRGEKGIEDFRFHVHGNAGSIISDLESHELLLDVVPRSEDERSAAVCRDHRLLRIDDQVEEHLLNLMRV